jgi:hypothetical protein
MSYLERVFEDTQYSLREIEKLYEENLKRRFGEDEFS